MLTPARIAAAGTVAIVALSFVLSFAALTDLAARAGVKFPVLWPLIVDGLIVVATVAVVALRDSVYAWLLLGSGALVSIAGNVVHAILPPGPIAPEVAAAVALVPPLALLAVTHLTVILARTGEQDASLEPELPAEMFVPTFERIEPRTFAEHHPPTPRAAEYGVPAPAPTPEFQPVEPTAAQAVNETPSTPAPVDVTIEAASSAPVAAPRPQGGKRHSDEKRAHAEHLLRTTDYSGHRIAAIVGVSEATVRRWKAAMQEPANP